MLGIKSVYLALLCFLVLSEASTENKHDNKACIPRERDALLAFRAGLIDPKNRLSSWKGYDCCKWRGITCSNITGHVVRLDLQNTYRQQYIYGGWFIDMSYALGGEVRSPISFLQHLNHLDLSYNNFSGAKIPEFIGSFNELAYLNLSNAEFGGKIPPQIGNLSSLRYLDLSFVSYNNIYSHDITWLTHLSSLKFLDMTAVNLSSAINWKRFGILPRLQTLHLCECELDDTTFTLSHVNFTELVTLDLRFNKLSNLLTFTWIQNLTKLSYVDFSCTYFDRRLLNTLGNKDSIETLYLSGNNLANMKSSDLKNLSNLKVLDLSLNEINGDITEFFDGLSSHKLQSLYLGWNNLNGNISSWIGRMTSLPALGLYRNNFSGHIPLSIRRLSRFVELDLRYNKFYGTLTEKHLSTMTSLESLWLSGNSLNITIDTNWIPQFRLKYFEISSCNLGPKFPQWLRLQTNIGSLDISNTSIIDELPTWFWHVFSNAYHLDLSENNLSGRMPTSLEFMSVRFIYLNDNKLQGTLPKLPNSLHELDLSRNALFGHSLPINMKDLSLRILLLKDNQLNGSIPQSLCQSQQLEFLDLSRNHLVGNIPKCWESDINATKDRNQTFVKQIILKALTLGYNNLSGQFPEYVKYCNNLIFLNLESNNFIGNAPPWIGKKLPSLRFLFLGSNKFSGTIPIQLLQLKQLQVLDLSHNNLNGMIPHSLRNLKEMTITDDGYIYEYQFWFGDYFARKIADLIFTEVNTKGQVLNYDTNIMYFKGLDLSCNNLEGNIPKEIGALVGLVNLNLSGNKLSGNIPQSIGYLQSLESLDLSSNRLFGLIPSSLSNLTTLSHLNLSYNNLSGSIPSGHQLQTLDDPSIYEGNNGLCGFPLPIECYENRTTSTSLVSKKDDGYEFLVGAIVGFATGVWIVYCVLILKKSWRIDFVDNAWWD